MNCKPKDLAVVVKDECYLVHPWTLERVSILKPGTIVRVLHTAPPDGYWVIEEPLRVRFEFKETGTSGFAIIAAISDDLLRPLKGDGISDDEVRELYTSQPFANTAQDAINEALRRVREAAR